MVGDTDGDMVGSEVVGEIDGDAVGVLLLSAVDIAAPANRASSDTGCSHVRGDRILHAAGRGVNVWSG